MTSLTFEITFMIIQVFGWLFIVLPLFETIHHRFFQSAHSTSATFRLVDWFYAFKKALTQQAAKESRSFVSLARKGLLFVSYVLILIGISTLPLSSAITWGENIYFADNGSEIFSPFLLLGLIFCAGFVHLLMGFSFDKHFIALSTIEKSATNQSAILILAIAFMTTPFVDWNTSLRELVDSQMTPVLGFLPAWGALTNPIAFICACIAMAIHLHQWQKDDYPAASVLRKSLQSELLGTELVTYRIARSLEHLLLYALIVVVFLGGPYFIDDSIYPFLALTIFTAKTFLLMFIVLGINYLLPQMQQSLSLRVIFLVLLPLEIIGYPLSLVLSEMLFLR